MRAVHTLEHSGRAQHVRLGITWPRKASRTCWSLNAAECLARRRQGSLPMRCNTQLYGQSCLNVCDGGRVRCALAGCTGKRSRTGFVPLSEFDERALLSDYRFLEEAAAVGHAAQRAAPGRRHAMPPPHLQELVHQVAHPTATLPRSGYVESDVRDLGGVCALLCRHLAALRCAGAPSGPALLCISSLVEQGVPGDTEGVERRQATVLGLRLPGTPSSHLIVSDHLQILARPTGRQLRSSTALP